MKQERNINTTKRFLSLVLLTLLLTSSLAGCLIFEPDQVDEDVDTDQDGVVDRQDDFPENPNETTDTDGDGEGNNADSDDDGDGVNDTLDLDPLNDLALAFSFTQVNVTEQLTRNSRGWVFLAVYQNGSLVQKLDDEGSSWSVYWEQPKNISASLVVNIPDNLTHHNFSVAAYQSKIRSSVLLDLGETNDSYLGNLTLNSTQLLLNGSQDYFLDGTLDNMSDEKNAQLTLSVELISFGYRISYQWSHKGKDYQLSYSFDPEPYYYYQGLSHTVRDYEDYVKYATPEDETVVELAGRLHTLALDAGLSTEEEAQFILNFVQSLKYAQDNTTTGIGEYPRYPVETLVDQMGDCEDTAILLVSLAEAVGIESVLLILPEATEDAGHAAAGLAVNLTGSHYTLQDVEFYYAETTGSGWTIGTMPEFESTEAYVYAV